MLLAGVLLTTCTRPPSVPEVVRRFDELARARTEPEASTANSTRVAVGGENRVVVARPDTIAHAEGLRVEKAGPRTFRTQLLDGLGEPLPMVEAKVRADGGEWQPRAVRTVGLDSTRSVEVALTAADVTQPVDVVVTAWVPPTPLDATTNPFRVPAGARLQFGAAVQSTPPAQARFRVSVARGAAKVDELWAATIDQKDGAGWHDVDLDLQPYAGEEVRLRVEAEFSGAVPRLGTRAAPRAVISAPLLLAPSAARPVVDNVILVSIDTLRADHLGAYGYSRRISPVLDQLAGAGTLFENVFAVWPETSASHMTILTSLYPTVHGIGLTRWGATVLPPWQLTLAEWLGRHGFTTGGITEDVLINAAVGFPRGFDTYRELPPNYENSVVSKNPIDGQPMARNRLGSVEEGVGQASRWLRAHRGQRFFLFLHTYQVHQRYAPGERYAALRNQFVNDGLTPSIPSADNFLATYDASIAYTDAQLAGLFSALDELKLRTRTLVVITSDHGEEFYEHRQFGHGTSLYDPALRVPLLFHCPGIIPAGKRIATRVSLLDVAPTILALLGEPPLPQAQGRSMASAVSAADATEPPPIFFELGDEFRAVRTDRVKVIRIQRKANSRTEVYDVHADPGETRQLPEDSPGVAEALRLLTAHDVECRNVRAQLETAAPPREPTPMAGELDEQTRERMRALGYEPPASP